EAGIRADPLGRESVQRRALPAAHLGNQGASNLMKHRFSRAYRRHASLAVAAAVAACAVALPAVANAEWQRGVNFTTYKPHAYAMPGTTTSLQRVAADGNDSVEIVSTWYSA